MSIIVKTQAELDRIPLNTKEQIYIEFGTCDNPAIVKSEYLHSVKACGNSFVKACGNSFVIANDNSFVIANDNSFVIANDNSSVIANDNSSVRARGNSSVETISDGYVVARGNSSVRAWGDSFVIANDNSSVDRLYTLESILQIVNEISKDNYIKIEFI